MGIFDKTSKEQQVKKLLTADDWFTLLDNHEKERAAAALKQKQIELEQFFAQGNLIAADFQQQELKDGKNPWGDMDRFEFDSHCGSYAFGAYEAAAKILTQLGFPTTAIRAEKQKTAPSHHGAQQFYSETRSILVIEKPKKKTAVKQ